MMAKRIFGLFLALCLIVGMMPMVVSGADEAAKTSSLTITTGTNDATVQWKPTMAEGMATKYAKNTETGGLIYTGVGESDWTLKAEWPTGGNPTLTLRNATLNNDTMNPSDKTTVYPTINITGSADFDILLQGTNVLNGNLAQPSATGYAPHRMVTAIRSTCTGLLKISGIDKEASLLVDCIGGYGIQRYYGATKLEKAEFTFELGNTGYGVAAILAMYDVAGYEDKTDVTVENCKMTVTAGGSSSAGIVLGKSDIYYSAANTSDIVIRNSIVNMTRPSTNWSTTATMMRYGKDASLTIDRSDVYIKSRRFAFVYAPTILNCGTPRAGYNAIERDFNIEPRTLMNDVDKGAGNYGMFQVLHTCMGGEPVIEKHAGECAKKQYAVSYCIVCGEECSRVEQEVTEPSKIHTPGQKTLLSKVDATYEGTGSFNSSNKEYQRMVEGTYTWQYTCSVCGEVWTEEENFKPAILNYISSGEGAANQNSYVGDNTAENYKVTLRQPGYEVYYVTKANGETYPNNSYMVVLTDEAEIAAGNWNVKFEYPVGGTPVLTLKNATIINNTGLWYGYAGWRDLAPLTIVLEGNNTIEQTLSSQGVAPLVLDTNNSVTINGMEGSSLTLGSRSIYSALATQNGDLTLNNVNLTLTRYNSNPTSTREDPAIGSRGNGDVTINGGSIDYVGFGVNGTASGNKYTRAGYKHLIRGNNITLNGTSITAHGTFGSKAGNIYAKGNLTVTESTLFFAHGFAYASDNQTMYGDAFKCGGTATFNYANGVTGKYSTGTTYVDAHVNWTEITYPTSYTDITTINKLQTLVTSSEYVRYLNIAPAKKLAAFIGTAVTVTENLDVDFLLNPAVVEGIEGTVEFTLDGVKLEPMPLSAVGKLEEDGYVITLPDLAAKDINKTITAVIKDAEGNTLTETKTDSVQAYALRLLRSGKYSEDTELNKALKTFLVDMLCYGSMAQVQFYNGETPLTTADLATAPLTGAEMDYASSELKTEAPITKPTAPGYVGTAFELKTYIGMHIALDATIVPDVAKAVVTFTDYENKAQTITIDQEDASSNAKYTIFVYSELAAANGRQDINWTFYNAADEEVLAITDSLAAYVGRMRDAYPYLDEMLMYCDSAAAYFTLAKAAAN